MKNRNKTNSTMSKKKKQAHNPETGFENIEEALTASERFIEKNQKKILMGLLAVIVIVGAAIAYTKLHKQPKNEKANAALYKGERYFQNQEDSIAIFGNENDYVGFEQIIKKYSGTKAADLAHAYAGISYSRLGDNEKALQHLKKFKGGDLTITPAITGAIGDVYVNMGNTEKAISHFKAAAKKANDDMLTPLYYKKAGLVYFNNGNYAKAIEVFEMIKNEYIQSPQAQEAPKYIEAAKLKQNQ